MIACTSSAQTKSDVAKVGAPAKKARGEKAWVLTKTPDGQPDLQGMWVNFDPTPFEKPVPGDVTTRDPVISFTDQAPSVEKRDSMVVDPPNGRVPNLTPYAAQVKADRLSHIHDSWTYDTSWNRCITRGVPSGMFPVVYDNSYQILQTPGYVTILYEMIHEARIIPIDGRPHIPDGVTQWNGDPRGHWEGNTLVVETTHFNGGGMYAEYRPLQYVPESTETSIVERFTRKSEKTIQYEVTIKDPKSFVAPWTVSMPLTKDDSYRMYEYTCHEGNKNYMEIHLGAGRLQDKENEQKGKEK